MVPDRVSPQLAEAIGDAARALLDAAILAEDEGHRHLADLLAGPAIDIPHYCRICGIEGGH